MTVLFLWVDLALFFNTYINPIASDALNWKNYICYCCWLAVELAIVWFFFVETETAPLKVRVSPDLCDATHAVWHRKLRNSSMAKNPSSSVGLRRPSDRWVWPVKQAWTARLLNTRKSRTRKGDRLLWKIPRPQSWCKQGWHVEHVLGKEVTALLSTQSSPVSHVYRIEINNGCFFPSLSHSVNVPL